VQLADLPKETLYVDCVEVWENERTPIRVFGVRLHSMGLSVREVAAILGWSGVECSHGAVWNWTHKLAEQQEDSPTAYLHHLTEKHDISEAEFLVDGGGYLTALARQKLSDQLNYTERNHIEKWFQTVTMRVDRFHTFWRGSQPSAKRWLRLFRYHYYRNRPNQALYGLTPAEVFFN